jgi:hypothetical protein
MTLYRLLERYDIDVQRPAAKPAAADQNDVQRPAAKPAAADQNDVQRPAVKPTAAGA